MSEETYKKQRSMHKALDMAILARQTEAALDIIAQPDFNPRYTFSDRKTRLNIHYAPAHLHYAFWFALEDVVDALLKKGADIHYNRGDRGTPLINFCSYLETRNRPDILDLLLHNGAAGSINAKAKETKMTALHHSANHSVLLETTKKLVAAGAKMNTLDAHNRTPLMLAASKGNLLTVQLLVSQGADLFLKNSSGLTARQIAANYEHTNVAKFLEEKETKIKEERRARKLDALADASVRLKEALVIEYPLKRKPRPLSPSR